MEVFIGMIMQAGWSFNTRSFTSCSGQLLPISDNQTLYSLLGTNFGGDGRVSYGIPDLRGRSAIGQGQFPGSQFNWRAGQAYGRENHVLAVSEMTNHTHIAEFKGEGGGASDPIIATATVNAHDGQGNSNGAAGNYWATGTVGAGRGAADVPNGYSSETTSLKQMASDAVQVSVSGGGGGITGGTVTNIATGAGQPFNIMQPTLAINYQIALQGIYPSRN
ncbi:MAG: hypothetical protein GQ474_10675 [Sulfurimonas sp.]|nr:hypothetical protein [Sulfurimonas sp.]